MATPTLALVPLTCSPLPSPDQTVLHCLQGYRASSTLTVPWWELGGHGRDSLIQMGDTVMVQKGIREQAWLSKTGRAHAKSGIREMDRTGALGAVALGGWELPLGLSVAIGPAFSTSPLEPLSPLHCRRI
jgi:hypothetical protein